ncbi:MAG: hypothetical protein LBG60_01290 [Bifidobacteriaceae bacterium]|nr:hypothetical protein [Bifidobacteriaceae bacterium]
MSETTIGQPVGPGGSLAGELRNWAKGTRWAGAAVELLLAGVRGRLAYRGAPWIEQLGADRAGRSYARINPEKLIEHAGPLSARDSSPKSSPT